MGRMDVLVLNEPNGREPIVARRRWRDPLPGSGASLTWSLLSSLCPRSPAQILMRGLLVNNLNLGVGIGGGELRVVFYASDAVAKSGDGEEADEVELSS